MSEQPLFPSSGIEVSRVYTPSSTGYAALSEQPGEFPFTRGIRADGYASQPLAIVHDLGSGTAIQANHRCHQLLSQGLKDYSITFDRPTRKGYDSDHIHAQGDVGRLGVTIDSVEDVQALFEGVSLDDTAPFLKAGAAGFILLALYVAVAKQRGADLSRVRGTLQHDILQEYAVHGTCIYPPKASMRILGDLFEWCSRELPQWNPFAVSGCAMREAGCSASQELAFTIANAKAYLQMARQKGWNIDTFGCRLSFLFNVQNDIFEEVARFRAARRIWANMMKESGATDPAAMMLQLHAQSGTNACTPLQNNNEQAAIQMLTVLLGGVQTLHLNAPDVPVHLSAEEAIRIGWRTPHVVAIESGVTSAIDPLAGSYYVETLTNKLEQAALQQIAQMEGMDSSGAIGYMQEEIARTIASGQQKIDNSERVRGANHYPDAAARPDPSPVSATDAAETLQEKKLIALKRRRDPAKIDTLLQLLNDAAASDDNIMPAVLEAVEHRATVGEVADTLREVFGDCSS